MWKQYETCWNKWQLLQFDDWHMTHSVYFKNNFKSILLLYFCQYHGFQHQGIIISSRNTCWKWIKQVLSSKWSINPNFPSLFENVFKTKTKLNFHFHTSLWYLNWFFVKAFKVSQRSLKIKILDIFYINRDRDRKGWKARLMWILIWLRSKLKSKVPVSIYFLKVNNRNSRNRYEMCSNLTIKTPKRCHWRRSGVFIITFEHISHLLLVILLLLLLWPVKY